MTYEQMKRRLAASRFRSRFHLTKGERAYVAERGFDVLQAQAERIVRERLAPAHPANDGRQTPMRGHAVFKAQHATATCCRGCFAKWYEIPAGKELSEAEISLAVGMIIGWLREQTGDTAAIPHTPELFGDPADGRG